MHRRKERTAKAKVGLLNPMPGPALRNLGRTGLEKARRRGRK